MAWEVDGPDNQGFISHRLVSTSLSISEEKSDYTVLDGAVVVGNFTELYEAKGLAEDIETRWCIENFSVEWVNPLTGRKLNVWR